MIAATYHYQFFTIFGGHVAKIYWCSQQEHVYVILMYSFTLTQRDLIN